MARPIALITGASSGIGERIALRLASSGHDLVLVARRGDELARVAALAAAVGAASETIVADLSQAADVAKVEVRILDDARPIEILVNNAGYGRFGKITELDAAGEANEIAVNVTALTLLSRAALVAMAPRKRGGILNVASLASFIPFPGFTTYAATKAFVTSFSEAIAEENRLHNITVTAVCPGPTETNFFAAAKAVPFSAKGMQTPEAVVKKALKAVKAGKPLVISGLANYIGAVFGTIAPDSLVTRVVGNVLRPKLKEKK